VEGSSRLDQAERLLSDHGIQLGPVQVAAGRSGVVLGFPRDPMLHVSWIALAVISGLIAAFKLRRS
jgi:hypothetical protein